jgi:hypothetical protein
MKSHKFGMTKVKIVDFFYINPQITIPIVISSPFWISSTGKKKKKKLNEKGNIICYSAIRQGI